MLLVELYVNDSLNENINPVGRLFYAASKFICTPNSLSQEVGLGLGAQAGEVRLHGVFVEAGFTHFRRAPETPFNLTWRRASSPGAQSPASGGVGRDSHGKHLAAGRRA